MSSRNTNEVTSKEDRGYSEQKIPIGEKSRYLL